MNEWIATFNKKRNSVRIRLKNGIIDFEQAFKAARKKKQYSFPFKDKEYTTRYKEETVAEHKKKFPKKKK